MTTRQEQIIEKSIELIAESGIQGLTIKNLSKKIGVSEPAIYRHFDSKTDILLTMLNNLHDFTENLSETILAKESNSLKKIEKVMVSYFDTFEKHPYWVSVIFSDEIFKNENVLKTRINEILQSKENLFVKLLGVAQKDKLIREDVNKKQIALIMMGSLRLIVKKWELSGYSFNLRKEGKKLFKTIFKLIAK